MIPLLGIQSLAKSFGTHFLFEGISFSLERGNRVGLIGPNGSGKSTLLKILSGLEEPDEGSITRKDGVRLGYACQEPEFPALPIEEIMVQSPLAGDAIELSTRAQILLGKAQFEDSRQLASQLSGGWKKRLEIVKALMSEPDILLLDEPTNHLDLEGIEWLENFLLKEKITYMVVSHDRYFLEKCCNKIIELNRCYPQGLFIADGNMSRFAELRDQFLDVQLQLERGLASTVRDETEWLRRTPQARTTKSRSRVDKAYALMEELSEIKQRNKTQKVDIDFASSDRSTRKLLVAKNLGKSFGDKLLFSNIDITLSPGVRLGVAGKNGTGKTTLMKILAGMIPHDAGTLKYADALKIVYFDQHREKLPLHITLKDALSPTSDTVNYRGQTIHVNGWAKRFLFTPDRLKLPLSALSGGERARILIARLMLEPADVLFLDEPTNDLDIDTLEVMEESLKSFPGAVVLISHDRCLVDRVCNQILGLGTGNEHRFFADYRQWEAANQQQTATTPKKATPLVTPQPSKATSTGKKLTYKEQKELDGMDDAITAIELKMEQLHAQLEDPSIHADADKSLELYRQLAAAEQEKERLFDRWQELESKL
jgi:ATP-binding cassette subfamily F protein uup